LIHKFQKFVSKMSYESFVADFEKVQALVAGMIALEETKEYKILAKMLVEKIKSILGNREIIRCDLVKICRLLQTSQLGVQVQNSILESFDKCIATMDEMVSCSPHSAKFKHNLTVINGIDSKISE